jgi:hypothetical protein
MIAIYNTKTERVPRYSNSPSINLWNCPSPIRYTVKPIDSYKTSGQDAFLVRETQGVATPLLSRLAHAHDQAVLRLAIRITGSHNNSEDIYKKTFLKVYTKRGGVPFERYSSSWIFRIVTNVFVDCLRRHRSHRGRSALEENVEDEGVEYDSRNPDGTLRQIDIDKCGSLECCFYFSSRASSKSCRLRYSTPENHHVDVI